jgi:diguanylate cyclase (GGDEF)-like protein
MSPYLVCDNETERLEALRSLQILHQPDLPELDAIVKLACELCQVPSAVITLIDEDTQWNVVRAGYDLESMPREHSFCNYTLAGRSLMVVEDATADLRFINNPLVTADNGLRFYAGVPLEVQSGMPVGTLCIADSKPRRMSAEAAEQLQRLALIAASLIRQRRDARDVALLSEKAATYGSRLAEQSREIAMHNRLMEDASVLGKMGAFEHDLESGQIRWSESMRRIHEVDKDDPILSNSFHLGDLSRFYNKRDLARYMEATRRARETRQAVDVESAFRTAKGKRRWVRVHVDYDFEDGKAVRRFGMVQDITRYKRLIARSDYLASRDPLTGLFNRNHFQRHAEEALCRARGTMSGIAMLDLDGFKAINDSYGHSAGDACLKATARRLRRAAPKGSMIVRPGGDEFFVVFNMTGDREAVRGAFEVVRKALEAPVEWNGVTFQVTGSIGIALLSEGEQRDIMGLMQEADLAVYKAKASGRNCIEFFAKGLSQQARTRFRQIDKGRDALNNDRFELFYQPKVHLSDRSLDGFEALLRCRQDDGAYAPPAQFLAALDDPEMSRRIGAVVVEKAVAQASAWRKQNLPFGHIAINVSSSQFIGTCFVGSLIEQMNNAGLQPDDVQIEVTEGVLLSSGSGVANGLKALSEHGIRIALDDFGTGYASLVHLRQLEFDTIKIDMSFVQSMLTSTADMAIVQAVLLLAGRLGKSVVAEGVETELQYDILRAYGCQFGQGYLFSRPEHPDRLDFARLAGQARLRAV